jgi:hypothetical protein
VLSDRVYDQSTKLMRRPGIIVASFSRLQRLERELSGAIRPRRLQRGRAAAVLEPSQSVLGDGRPEQIAAPPFQARPLRGRHVDVGVQLEAARCVCRGAVESSVPCKAVVEAGIKSPTR